VFGSCGMAVSSDIVVGFQPLLRSPARSNPFPQSIRDRLPVQGLATDSTADDH
jgi:hypothetical protein